MEDFSFFEEAGNLQNRFNFFIHKFNIGFFSPPDLAQFTLSFRGNEKIASVGSKSLYNKKLNKMKR